MLVAVSIAAPHWASPYFLRGAKTLHGSSRDAFLLWFLPCGLFGFAVFMDRPVRWWCWNVRVYVCFFSFFPFFLGGSSLFAFLEWRRCPRRLSCARRGARGRGDEDLAQEGRFEQNAQDRKRLGSLRTRQERCSEMFPPRPLLMLVLTFLVFGYILVWALFGETEHSRFAEKH